MGAVFSRRRGGVDESRRPATHGPSCFYGREGRGPSFAVDKLGAVGKGVGNDPQLRPQAATPPWPHRVAALPQERQARTAGIGYAFYQANLSGSSSRFFLYVRDGLAKKTAGGKRLRRVFQRGGR